MSDDIIAAALTYARRGWPVVPLHAVERGECTCPGGDGCGSPGKHPLTSRGLNDATTDEGKIRPWFAIYEAANIGIATGAVSGLVVLDIDPRNGGDESLAAYLAENGDLPATVEVATGGGGRHLYFAHPGGSVKSRKGFLPGLDLKSDGGYVVAPPSSHVSGGRYEGDLCGTFAPLPDSLLEWQGGSRYALKALASEIHDLGEVTEGSRNESVNTAAFNLGQLVWNGELSEALFWRHLTATGVNIGLTESETKRAIKSGLQGAKDKPRRQNKPQPGRALTDLGNAERLVAKHGDDLRFCFAWNTWLVWDGCRFVTDDTGGIQRRAKETVRSIYAEAVASESDEARQSLAKHGARSESERAIKAMVNLAKSEPTVPVTPTELDNDPWLLNVLNGTIDLRSGRLRPHRKTDLITKMAPVEHDEHADCPTWLAFLDRVMDGNADLIRFLQRAVGYSLTGDVSERVMFLLHGSGRNGKSTFIETVAALLGDYARQAESDTLMAKKDGGVNNDVARLKGARFVPATETDQDKKLAVAKVKAMTGGDTITARFLFQEHFEFEPEFKIWLATNHLPAIYETADAIWDRIRLVPFTVRISDQEVNGKLKDHLRDHELPGILRWALEGLREWRSAGLGNPAEVSEATAAYRGDLDVIGDFLEERCETGLLPTDRQPAQALYDSFRWWCQANGEEVQTNKQFARALTERGYKRHRNKTGWAYLGLRLLPHGRSS